MTLELPPRSAKPRSHGITSMIDFGPDAFGWTAGPEGIRNLLDCCAACIDGAKIWAMNALLLPREVLKAAARTCRDYGVTPFAGGILFEYAWQRGELDALESLLAALDVGGLEISENRPGRVTNRTDTNRYTRRSAPDVQCSEPTGHPARARFRLITAAPGA